jgi:hypothetical protein
MHRTKRVLVAVATATLVGVLAPGVAAAKPSRSHDTFNSQQRATLQSIAKDTWRFFEKDVDPKTNLPMDNIGPGTQKGTYTNASNVGTYLWSVVAAHDLHLISTHEADARVSATLHEVQQMERSHGFLYQWYDTDTGQKIVGPPDNVPCTQDTGTHPDTCDFLSAVDNGWYASGLVVVRQALSHERTLASTLLGQMDFSIFYDNRPQKAGCNTNPDFNGDPTGQMYGGYNVGYGPATYHNGALFSDPRIAMYLGMGLHQMPGDVWWRTWRTLPPKQCSTDPDFSWQGQNPGGYWKTVHDPLSGKDFNVWEGHYTYPGTSLKFIPTWAGGMFEGLMADQVVPETTWGPHSFGLADQRLAQVQIKYDTQQLKLPVWGSSPSSTADDTGGYSAFGVQGQQFPTGGQLAQDPSTDPTVESTVTPHASFIALGVAPQQAYANIVTLQRRYPGIYTSDGGFYDAVNPSTGSIGHRMLVLDQSMIMASLDNALNDRQMQRWFAADPVSAAAHAVLGAEHMSI